MIRCICDEYIVNKTRSERDVDEVCSLCKVHLIS